jgi:hypothetical protein
LAQLVIDAIERNYSFIDTAELTLRQVHMDGSVGKPQLVVQPTEDGGQLRITRSPKTEHSLRVTLCGDDLRVERGPLDGNGPADAQEVLVHRAGLWTQYQPEHRAAWIRRQGEMPGTTALDAAACEQRHRLAQC